MGLGKRRIVVLYALLATSLLMVSLFVVNDYQARTEYDQELNLFSSAPGGRAWDYLQNSTYTELLFEVDILSPYLEDGLGQKQFNLSYLAEHFDVAEELIKEECMNKTVRYVWSSSQFDYSYTVYTPRYPEYTASELRVLAESNRNYLTGGHTCVIHVIFLDGRYVPSSSSGPVIGGTIYAGTTVDATTVFIFLPETVENSLYGPEYPYLSRDLAHEVGHLLGLVAPFGEDSPYNAPNATEHRDLRSVRHCSNASCLMSTDINKRNELCDECKTDLAYLRNSTAPYVALSFPDPEWIPITIGVALGMIAAALLVVPKKR